MFDNRKTMELQNLHGVENFKKLTIPQMLERGKLIELLESAESAVYWNSSDKGFIEKIAEHLIANGVTIPVRCEECKYSYDGVANLMCGRCGQNINGIRLGGVSVKAEHFCSYGERKDND